MERFRIRDEDHVKMVLIVLIGRGLAMEKRDLNKWITKACDTRAQRAIHELRVSRKIPFPDQDVLTKEDIRKLNKVIHILLEQEYIFDMVCSSVKNGELIKRRYLDNDRSITGELVNTAKKEAVKQLKQLIEIGEIEPRLLKKDLLVLFRSSHGGVASFF